MRRTRAKIKNKINKEMGVKEQTQKKKKQSK
jgi:hypothetical protein